jgi:O-antigen ligase
MFRQNPLGIGTGSYARAFRDLGVVEGMTNNNLGKEKPAHSGWLKVLVENGIAGVLLLAAYVGSFAFVGWRSGNRNLFVLGCLVTIAFSVAFISSEFQGKGLWFLAAGVTTLLHRQGMAEMLRRLPR